MTPPLAIPTSNLQQHPNLIRPDFRLVPDSISTSLGIQSGLPLSHSLTIHISSSSPSCSLAAALSSRWSVVARFFRFPRRAARRHWSDGSTSQPQRQPRSIKSSVRPCPMHHSVTSCPVIHSHSLSLSLSICSLFRGFSICHHSSRIATIKMSSIHLNNSIAEDEQPISRTYQYRKVCTKKWPISPLLFIIILYPSSIASPIKTVELT